VELKKLLGIKKLERIECFDISNLTGKEAVGAMAVFTAGLPNKTQYRHFKIKTVKKIDDYAMIAEILSRRLKHLSDWGMPSLIIIDGGKGHLNTAIKILKAKNLKIKAVSLAKKFETLNFIRNKKFIEFKLPPDTPIYLFLQRIRDEAHRFAIIYHRKLRNKITNNN